MDESSGVILIVLSLIFPPLVLGIIFWDGKKDKI